MCNKLHPDFAPIEESGYGWKVFSEVSNGILLPLYYTNHYVNARGELLSGESIHRVVWDDSFFFGIDQSAYGFCFFESKRDAIKLVKSLPKYSSITTKAVIKKIAYRRGLGKNYEEIHGNYYISMLCKEFEVTE